jgi:hypothetical protein
MRHKELAMDLLMSLAFVLGAAAILLLLRMLWPA